MTTDMQTIREALEYLHSLKSGLEDPINSGFQIKRMKDFANFVGNPELEYPVIHIGGTAGKGSTTHLVSRILMALGYKVGIHTSPYLVSLNEQYLIGQPNTNTPNQCTNQKLIQLIDWFKDKHDSYLQEGNLSLSAYEARISTIFKYFANQKVDVAIIEVAMGGKLDATNIVDSNIAILNSVGLDHTEFLGNTLEKITNDKMRIMKRGKEFISGIINPTLTQMIKNYSKEMNNNLSMINRDFRINISQHNMYGTTFNFSNNQLKLTNIHLPLFGAYQVHNAALAIQAVSHFIKDASKLTTNILNMAFKNIQIKARFDIVNKNPLIIIDGAHNKLKINSLVDSITKTKELSTLKPTVLMGFKEGKDITPMINKLLSLNPQKIFISDFIRKYHSNITSVDITKIKKYLISQQFEENNIYLFNQPIDAFNKLKDSLDANSYGLVTGSLYLAGNIYTKLNND